MKGNDANMQVADVQFFSAADGAGTPILAAGNPIIAIDQTGGGGSSRNPTAESPQKLIDGNTTTKYLNFGEDDSGVVITPAIGATLVDGIELWTANDSPERDPASYSLYGVNVGLSFDENDQGNNAPWELISSGSISAPAARGESTGIISFENDEFYTSCKLVFNSVKDGAAANSLLVAELKLHGSAITVPEPASAALVALGAGALLFGRRRR